jgi:trk system potassium uptake protein TrkH
VFKGILCQIKQILRPHSVNTVRLDKEAVPDETVRSATCYISIYLVLIVFGVLLISLDGFDFTTNATAVITCINNVGPGLGAVGPAGNFSGFSGLSTVLLSVIMLIGRLEIMPMLIFFSPLAWKKR